MNERYEFIKSVVRNAGDMVLESRDKHLEITNKDGDPRNILTNVDIEVNEYISSEINKRFPGETIYSEEMDTEDISSGSFWSIDPIDGTANFSCGIPHYAVVIAYVENGAPAAGAVYNPVTRELFSFTKGQGAYLDDKPIKVSSKTKLDESAIFMTSSRKPENWDWATHLYRFLLGKANKIRVMASSGLDVCFVASGRIEACIYPTMTTLDIIAAIGILREAGGTFEGVNGPLEELSKVPQRVLAANNHEILEAVKEGLI